MPKRVDHHARRTLIADALIRLASDRGLEAVSLRHVAAEAGVSSGMVQHYFRTKAEMMIFALEVISERAQARITAAVEALGASPSPRDQVRTLLVELLPLDEPRRVEGGVALAYFAYAAVKPELTATLRESTVQMGAFVADRIRDAQAGGTAPAGVDPDSAAMGLLALVEGLGLHLLGGHYPADTGVAVFDAQLTTIFGPPRP